MVTRSNEASGYPCMRASTGGEGGRHQKDAHELVPRVPNGPACPQWCLQRLQKEEKEDEGLVTHGGFEIPMNVALHPTLPSLLDGLPAHPEMDLAPLMNGNGNSR